VEHPAEAIDRGAQAIGDDVAVAAQKIIGRASCRFVAAEEREEFLSHLVEAHAASVKPSLAATRMPTEAVAAQAKADAEQAKAAGDEVAAAKAEQLALAMSPGRSSASRAGAGDRQRRSVPGNCAKPRARDVGRVRG
jgi:hypothetical protein